MARQRPVPPAEVHGMGLGLFGDEQLAQRPVVPEPMPIKPAKGSKPRALSVPSPAPLACPDASYLLPGATAVLLSHEATKEGFEATALSIGPGGEVERRTTYRADSALWAEAGALRRFVDGLPEGNALHLVSRSNEVVGQLTVNLGTWARCGLLDAGNLESWFDQRAKTFWSRVHAGLARHRWRFVVEDIALLHHFNKTANASTKAAS